MRSSRTRKAVVVIPIALAWVLPDLTGLAQQAVAGKPCRVSGKASSGSKPLPGVSLVIRAGDQVVGVTSTDIDGTFAFTLVPGTTYRATAELTGFVKVEKEFALADAVPPCDATADLELPLQPSTTAAPGAATPAGGAQTPGRGGGAAFESLTVQTDATAAAGLAVNPPDREQTEAAIRSLLPPGFSTELPTEAVTMTGNMASIDRGMLNDRLQAIGRGEFDPVTGQFAPVLGPDGQPLPGGDQVGRGGRGGPGGRAGGPRGGGPGGRGGRGALGGRGVQQRLYNLTSNYSFGGSALDSAPYQLRSDSVAEKRPYHRQNFTTTFGGPVRLPGVYDGTRRTNFTLSYTGSRGANLFDQYATVPTDAIRSGDFSSVAAPIINPATGEPYPNNQIPETDIHPGAASLLRFLPSPNLPGTTRNFHFTTTSQSVSDAVNIRVTHNFTAPAAGAGGRGGGGRGGGGGGRAGGPGGRGGRGTTVNMNASLQYRRNHNDSINVFPTLGGRSEGSSITVPVGLNVARNRQTHAINLNISRSTSHGVNRYAFLENVAADAGINGVSTDPYAWGVPTLNFSTYSDLRDMTPSQRSDTRLSLTYAWTKPMQNLRHTFRVGGDFRQDWSAAQTDSNARGEFVFTGLYAAGGSQIPRGAGFDFADFLLGMPQQASINYGPGLVRMRGRAFSAYVQDDWRVRGNLTVNAGVRYELVWPYFETHGHMVNLDVNDDFTAAAPVLSGQPGAFHGTYPDALVDLDANNVAPRVGVAWALRPGLVVRGGYGVAYNAGSYATIARQLVAQPPFATANTSVGTADSALDWSNPFVTATPATTTNNFGVDRNYVLGFVQTWNADVAKVIGQAWDVGAGYTGTKGSNLDLVRAPNRGPDGLRIPDVQPFTWHTSEARSQLHAGTFRLSRRPVRGIGAGISYTLAKSQDNASTLGGGRTTVAQDDQNLEAEWGLSSFDRRHQISANANIELPFGPNRRWLNGGGLWASLFENWRVNTTFTWQSGAPFTPTVSGAASDVARGTNGTLRANYTGAPIQLSNPTIDLFFNTEAFTIPEPGTYGNAARNLIIGPGSKSLNASFSRDVRFGGNRSVSITANATNLLNLVQYAGLNTNVNSPNFGQITSVRPMRSISLSFNVRY